MPPQENFEIYMDMDRIWSNFQSNKLDLFVYVFNSVIGGLRPCAPGMYMSFGNLLAYD